MVVMQCKGVCHMSSQVAQNEMLEKSGGKLLNGK